VVYCVLRAMLHRVAAATSAHAAWKTKGSVLGVVHQLARRIRPGSLGIWACAGCRLAISNASNSRDCCRPLHLG